MFRDRLTPMAVISLALLGFQYLLGMYANLFLSFPTTDPFSAAASATLPLYVHISTGVALFGLAVAMVVVAQRGGDRGSALIAGLVVLAITIAGWGGFRFLFGGQDGTYSFLMATGLIIALLAQAHVSQRSARHARESVSS